MCLMRVNRTIIPYFYEVNKINKQEWKWTGASKGTPRNPSLFLILFLTSEIKSEDVRPGVVPKWLIPRMGRTAVIRS